MCHELFPVIQVDLKVGVSQMDDSRVVNQLRVQTILFLAVQSTTYQFESLTALMEKVSENKKRSWCH